QLVDIIAKGGNFLLNIGPKADGSFPQESIDRLNEISKWMAVNSKFVHGTKMWKPYMEGENEMLFEYYDTPDVASVQLPFTVHDIRFTTKGNIIYAACLNWPKEDVQIKSMGKEVIPNMIITNIELLGSEEKLLWNQEDNFLRILPPKEKPCKYVYVFKVTLENNL
ncbi:MAG: alpha-L-fucosidase, partial [Ignavibacteriaceae bacterium]